MSKSLKKQLNRNQKKIKNLHKKQSLNLFLPNPLTKSLNLILSLLRNP
jgi:hypothetical protein